MKSTSAHTATRAAKKASAFQQANPAKYKIFPVPSKYLYQINV